jgi:predicted ATPase
MRRLCVEVALEPLAKTAIRTLLSRELKQEDLPSGLTSFVHQHSEGNPLFAIAILEHLIAQRFLLCNGTGDAKRWQQRARFEEIEADVPAGLAQMIELEIDRLGPDEQRVLEAGSLVSIAFPAWAVAAALEQDVAEIEEICEAMSRRLHFLERAGEDELPDGSRSTFFVFAHGLYREVLYQRQSQSRRARMHARIAERLTALFTGREDNVTREVAYHYEAAGQWERAVQVLCASAHQAQQRHAYAEAAGLLEDALKMAGNLKGSVGSECIREITDALAHAQRISMSTTAEKS